MKKLVLYSIIVTGIILVLPSCKKQDSIYEKYIVSNGLIYPGKVLEAEAFSGKNRIEIVWKNNPEPSVEKARIFWNNYTDSIDVNIDLNSETTRTIINDLPENTYSFMIRTYDNEGNISIPVEVTGIVYGNIYEQSLINRSIKTRLYVPDDLTLEWNVAEETELVTSVTYTDLDGNTHTIFVDPSESSTFIANFDVQKPVKYSTTHKPDSKAIDVFNAIETQTMIDPVILVPKNTWLPFPLPTDIAMLNDNATYPGGQYPLRSMWNDNFSDFCHTVDLATTTLPMILTWDIGRRVILHRMRIWPRNHATDNISQSCPQDFEIWGSLEPNPDGSLDETWTKLGTFKIIKPSGVLGAGNATDLAAAQAGFEFSFVDPSVSVQYIRLVAYSTYAAEGQNNRILLAEISFWGELTR